MHSMRITWFASLRFNTASSQISTVSEDAEIEPRIVTTLALAVRRANHSAIQYTMMHLIHNRLHLIHTRLYLIHTRLHLIHTRPYLIYTRLHLFHVEPFLPSLSACQPLACLSYQYLSVQNIVPCTCNKLSQSIVPRFLYPCTLYTVYSMSVCIRSYVFSVKLSEYLLSIYSISSMLNKKWEETFKTCCRENIINNWNKIFENTSHTVYPHVHA